MPIALYLAMTAAEMASYPQLPNHVAWMACHFSSSGQGLSNFPQTLPQRSILIVDDHLPFQDHSAETILRQLSDVAERFDLSGILLDFQRPSVPQVQSLTSMLVSQLPCPVVAPPCYAPNNAPVFLSPCPANCRMEHHLAPCLDRPIWLEAAADGLEVTVTNLGTTQRLPFAQRYEELPYKDDALHCHYRIHLQDNAVRFSLQRTREDLQALLEEAEYLGVTRAIGLWQELKK